MKLGSISLTVTALTAVLSLALPWSLATRPSLRRSPRPGEV